MLDRLAELLKYKKPTYGEGYLIASGTTVPSAVRGYRTGCIFQKTDGGAGTSLYVNEGSVSSCSFQALAALTAAQEALLGATAGTIAASKAVIVDAYKTLRWGGFNTAAALTDAVPFSSVPNTWADGQYDILSVFGGTGADLTGAASAKCGRFRHVVNFSGTQDGEVYGLVGQLVAKTVVLGLYSAGLMGTIESNGGFHAGDGTSASYPCHAGVIGRPGGASITVDSGATLAALAALSNTTSITASAGDYVGVYVAKCQSGSDAFTVGIKVSDSAATVGVKVGSSTTGILLSSTYTGNAIDFSGATITPNGSTGPCLIRMGSYTTPINYGASNNQSGLIRIHSTCSGDNTSYDRGLFVLTRTTGAKGAYPVAGLAEANNTGTGPKVLGAAQFIAQLGADGSASALAATDSGALAGMYGVWAKVTANTLCSTSASSRVAALWVDNQMNCTVAGEEYGIFASTGGARPEGFIGFKTTSSGYDNLLYFDTTFNSGAGTCVETSAIPGTQDARIKVWYDGTQYYIPLYK